jgi:hypothetical protein
MFREATLSCGVEKKIFPSTTHIKMNDDVQFLNILYIGGKFGELKRGNITFSKGLIEFDSQVVVEMDGSDYVCLPGFINAAMEHFVQIH